MLREIRKLKKRGTQNYIRALQYRGIISAHLNEAGYICYDPEELAKYKKTHKRGRPPKITNKQK